MKEELNIPLNFAESWQNIVNLISDLENVKAALILEISEEYIEILASSENEDNPYEAGEKRHMENDLYFEPVIRNRAELIISNALSNEKWKERVSANKGMISCICLPIFLINGESFGELCILDDQVHKYTENNIQLLKYFRELIQYQLNAFLVINKNSHLKQKFPRVKISKNLPHFIHICSFCKRIKDKEKKWTPLEEFFAKYIDIVFSHGICEDCLEKHYGYLFENRKAHKK